MSVSYNGNLLPPVASPAGITSKGGNGSSGNISSFPDNTTLLFSVLRPARSRLYNVESTCLSSRTIQKTTTTQLSRGPRMFTASAVDPPRLLRSHSALLLQQWSCFNPQTRTQRGFSASVTPRCLRQALKRGRGYPMLTQKRRLGSRGCLHVTRRSTSTQRWKHLLALL